MAQQRMETIEIGTSQLRATILTYGATLAELHAADRSGAFGDVLLGFTTDAGWHCAANPCMGCIIGRVAGRTAPDLMIDGQLHLLPGCDGGGGGIKPSTNLHGGLRLNRANWKVQLRESDAITMQTLCAGEVSGFPGAFEALPALRAGAILLVTRHRRRHLYRALSSRGGASAHELHGNIHSLLTCISDQSRIFQSVSRC